MENWQSPELIFNQSHARLFELDEQDILCIYVCHVSIDRQVDYGQTQVKSLLLISSIFDAMNFQHFWGKA